MEFTEDTEPGDDEQVLLVGEDERGLRLDVFLVARLPDISRSQIQRWVDARTVQVNGEAARASLKVQTGDLVLVTVPALRPTHIVAQAIPLDIVYEDDDLLVINKRRGMVVHPAPGAEDKTLVNALLAHCTNLSGVGGVARPGIVHRLDKDTTGLLVVAKTDAAHHSLQAQIQARTAVRRYLALVWGRVGFEEAVVDAPLGRHPHDRKRMAIAEPGLGVVNPREAVTHLYVAERYDGFTLLECKLETGRTHQIRVHVAFAGHPVVGDPVYGGLRRVAAENGRRVMRGANGERLPDANELIVALHGQALHAFFLSFTHPRTGEELAFEVPPPADMQALLDYLGGDEADEAGR